MTLTRKPQVSVIMLTYNRETMVSRAIESVLSQTMKSYEFIIVDNGSTDGSGQVADGYAKQDRRIRVIHRERGNIGSGRNAGLDDAEGEYIAFIDDDDWCEPDYLEFLYGLAAENGADVAVCGAADKVFDEKRIMNAEETLLELFWRKKFNVQFPTKLIHRKRFNALRFSGSAKYDDIELMPQILAGANCIAYHGLSKYTFFRHEANNSAWTTDHSLLTRDTLGEYLSVYRKRTEWLIGLFPGSADAWRYFEWSFMISMVEKIERLGINGCERQLGEILVELGRHKDEFVEGRFAFDFEKEWMESYVYA